MVRLYFLYKLSEQDRKKSDDQRTPIPYYVLGFLSYHIKDRNNVGCYNKLLDKIFSLSNEQLMKVYKYLTALSAMYRRETGKDYNVLIKQKMDYTNLDKQIDTHKLIDSDLYKLIATDAEI